jgi:hypothetical protein
MIYLDSVGSFIDIVTKIVYPAKTQNTPDMEMGISLDEVVDEWFDGLSSKDLKNLKSLKLI